MREHRTKEAPIYIIFFAFLHQKELLVENGNDFNKNIHTHILNLPMKSSRTLNYITSVIMKSLLPCLNRGQFLLSKS